MKIPGLTTRLTEAKIPVMRLHYSADPAKRPGTTAGDAWIARSSAAYPGGTNSPRWRKEMEIEWSALGGMKLFPSWEQWLGAGRIVIPPFDPVGYKLYGAYDHGWRNPAAYIVFGVNGDGDIVALWEMYGSGIGVMNTARVIRGDPVVTSMGERFQGNPRAGKEVWRVADPSIWAEDQPMSDGTNKSVAELFRRNHVTFVKGERGGDSMVAEWLHGHFWKEPTAPLFRITTDCPKLIWEIGQQRHKQVSARVAINQDQPEGLVDKDNHAWDAMKMFLKRFPPKAYKAPTKREPNSFSWWRDMKKLGGTGRTFRV